MTDKQLRRLNRAALIELLIEQAEANEALEAKVALLEQQVKSKTIAVSTAGSMADAAMELNNVFTSADKAAQQYLENIKDLNQKGDAIIEAAKRQASQILSNAQAEASRLRGEPAIPEKTAEKPKTVKNQAAEKPSFKKRQEAERKPAAKSSAPPPRRESATKQRKSDPVDAMFDSAFSEMRRKNK